MEEVFKFYKETTPYNSKHNKNIYEVSNYGRVKCNGKIVEPEIYVGYYRVHSIIVHRAVAELFVPNPENKSEVDHIDGNKHNNCVDNLRWVTHKENMNNSITCKKISESHKGKQHTEDTKRKMGAKHKGLKHTQTTKNRISSTHRGMHKGWTWKIVDGKRMWIE